MSMFQVPIVAVDKQQNYEKPSIGTRIGSIAVGGAAYLTGATCSTLAGNGLSITNISRLSNSLPKDQVEIVAEGAQKAIVDSGLEKKGTEIIRINSSNADFALQRLVDSTDNFALRMIKKLCGEKFAERIKFQAYLPFINAVEKGKNAFCAFRPGLIFVPEEKLSLTIFHEMGHAYNAQISTIGRTLQKCKPLMFLAPVILGISLLKTKKASDQKPEGIFDKTTTFIKDHAGKLTFAALLPTLAEEGLASQWGNKFAKQVLSPELANKVIKANRYSFAGYLIAFSGISAAVYGAKKLKDWIAQPKFAEQKNNHV